MTGMGKPTGNDRNQEYVYDPAADLWKTISSTWTTAYEVTFASLTSGSFTNGINVLDGKNWTVENKSNASDFGINPSFGGLTIKGTSTTRTWGGVNRDAPIILINTNNLLTGVYLPNVELRASVTFELTGAAVSTTLLGLAIGNLSTGSNTNVGMFNALVGFVGGAISLLYQTNIGLTTNQSAFDTARGGDRAMQLHVKDMYTARCLTTQSGSFENGVMPLSQSWIPRAEITGPPAAAGTAGSVVGDGKRQFLIVFRKLILLSACTVSGAALPAQHLQSIFEDY